MGSCSQLTYTCRRIWPTRVTGWRLACRMTPCSAVCPSLNSERSLVLTNCKPRWSRIFISRRCPLWLTLKIPFIPLIEEMERSYASNLIASADCHDSAYSYPSLPSIWIRHLDLAIPGLARYSLSNLQLLKQSLRILWTEHFSVPVASWIYANLTHASPQSHQFGE